MTITRNHHRIVFATFWLTVAAVVSAFGGSAPAPSPTLSPSPSPSPMTSPSPEPLKVVEKTSTASFELSHLKDTPEKTLAKWCSDVGVEIKKLKWKIEPCQGIDWKIGGVSVEGRPLVYAEFGDPNSSNSTLILSMIHGDEITPLYLAIQAAHWMREHQKEYGKYRVVIAPLVNPDSFFRRPRTRVNARGVDVNRNFATKDWGSRALAAWKSRFGKNPRRFPGWQPRSEPETIFQEDMIRHAHPQKIMGIHAPLNFMDYDGPTTLALDKFPKEYVHECLKLRSKLKAVSGGFFPGSLGNYAGRELGIPTLTLELPSADPAKAEAYWKRFSEGIRTMIEFAVPNNVARVEPIKPRS